MSHPSQTDPRLLAAQLIAGVLDEGRMVTDAPLGQADPAARARARRLAQTVLKNFARTETLLSPHLRKSPAPLVMALLRLALIEVHVLGANAHGVVNATVSALRANKKTANAAGMANAVLRKACSYEGWDDLPMQRLPGWLGRRLKGAYGAEAVLAIEAAHADTPPIDITPRPNATELPQGEELPNGSIRLSAGVQVSALPGFEAGQWWVQDAAASLPAMILAPKAGERVLDICAAPGGKTMQLAALGAEVTALDISEARLARVRENLKRTGLNATIVCDDALTWQPDAPADAILLDAPCSATGTIRRHPDLPFLRKPADVAELVALQTQLLDRALSLLKPGGRLMYCTCSLLPDEGEAQITALLARNPGVTVLPMPTQAFGRATPEGGWRTLPGDLPGGNDGFYMALLGRSDS